MRHPCDNSASERLPEGGGEDTQLVAVLGDGAAGDADALLAQAADYLFVGHGARFFGDYLFYHVFGREGG